MTRPVELFSNDEFELQVIPVGESFEVAATGVARGLGYRDATNLIRLLPESCTSKRYSPVSTPDDQGTWFLTEAGFYRAVGQRTTSRVKGAAQRATVERFQSWIFDEVLPSLRRTGTYTIPSQTGAHDFFEPHTLTWDEACALIRQRYGIPMGVNELTRSLRTAGILKQTGAPRKEWAHAFWFTGSSWNVHPHMVPELTRKVVDVGRELHDFRMLQAQLELDGVGSPAVLEREPRPSRGRGGTSRPPGREGENVRPADDRP